MGRLFLIKLDDDEIYHCKFCRTELAFIDGIISEDFTFRGRRAYLFWNISNVTKGEPEQSETGPSPSVDAFCVGCGSIVGCKTPIKDSLLNKAECVLERYKVVDPNGNCFFKPVEVQDQ